MPRRSILSAAERDSLLALPDTRYPSSKLCSACDRHEHTREATVFGNWEIKPNPGPQPNIPMLSIITAPSSEGQIHVRHHHHVLVIGGRVSKCYAFHQITLAHAEHRDIQWASK